MKNNNNLRLLGLHSMNDYILTPEQGIIYCSSDGNYTDIFLSDGQKITVCKKIKELESVLSDNYFVRVHRSHLINLLHVTKFTKKDGWQLTLRNGETLSVSRSNRRKLMDYIHTI